MAFVHRIWGATGGHRTDQRAQGGHRGALPLSTADCFLGGQSNSTTGGHLPGMRMILVWSLASKESHEHSLE